MTSPPSPIPAEHAVDFSRRSMDVLDRYAAERMEELGIPPERIGSGDHEHGIAWCAFNPHERQGGGLTPDGRINVDSGVLNLDLHPVAEWARGRLRHRIDAAIAHEHEEAEGGSHEYAVEHAPETDLPVGGPVRELLRAIRGRATPGGGPIRPR